MIGRICCLLVTALALSGWSGAHAAGPASCPALFVPEGYRLTCEEFGDPARPWRLTVRPEGELLANLSVLTLRPVDEPVDDPDIWLREQLTLNLSDVGVALSDVLARPESPLFDPSLASSLDRMVRSLRVLDQLPLRSCDFPAMAADGGHWQLECAWEAGPVQLLGELRLAYRGEDAYALSIWAVNPRRMRHLVAIANSF